MSNHVVGTSFDGGTIRLLAWVHERINSLGNATCIPIFPQFFRWSRSQILKYEKQAMIKLEAIKVEEVTHLFVMNREEEKLLEPPSRDFSAPASSLSSIVLMGAVHILGEPKRKGQEKRKNMASEEKRESSHKKKKTVCMEERTKKQEEERHGRLREIDAARLETLTQREREKERDGEESQIENPNNGIEEREEENAEKVQEREEDEAEEDLQRENKTKAKEDKGKSPWCVQLRSKDLVPYEGLNTSGRGN